MNRIIDRSQALNEIKDDGSSGAQLKSDIPRLKRRVALLNRAIFFSTLSAIITAVFVIVSFVMAYFDVQREYGVALLFGATLAAFTKSPVNLVRESLIALHEYDHFSAS